MQEDAFSGAPMEELLGKVGATNSPKRFPKARVPHIDYLRNCKHPLSQSTYAL